MFIRGKHEGNPTKILEELKKARVTLGLQLVLRPIQLWELIFPQEAYSQVAADLNFLPGDGYTANTNDMGLGWVLRKYLKCDKVPPLDPDKLYIRDKGKPRMDAGNPKRYCKSYPIDNSYVDQVAIGVKYDKFTEWETEDI